MQSESEAPSVTEHRHLEELAAALERLDDGSGDAKAIRWALRRLALAEELAGTVEQIAKQKLSSEVSAATHADADYEGGYNLCVEEARAALSRFRAEESGG